MLCPNVDTLLFHIVIALYRYCFSHMGTVPYPLSLSTVIATRKLVALSLLKVIAFGIFEQLSLLLVTAQGILEALCFLKLRLEKRPKAITYNAVSILL